MSFLTDLVMTKPKMKPRARMGMMRVCESSATLHLIQQARVLLKLMMLAVSGGMFLFVLVFFHCYGDSKVPCCHSAML